MSDNPTIGTSSTYQDTSLQGMYQFLRDWLTENNIPISHSVENFNALINTFFGREQDGVWAVNLMQRHFDTFTGATTAPSTRRLPSTSTTT